MIVVGSGVRWNLLTSSLAQVAREPRYAVGATLACFRRPQPPCFNGKLVWIREDNVNAVTLSLRRKASRTSSSNLLAAARVSDGGDERRMWLREGREEPLIMAKAC